LDEFALSGPGAFGPFSVQVFRTSGPSKGQGENGNGKKVMQHTEQSVTDKTPKLTAGGVFASHRCQRAPATPPPALAAGGPEGIPGGLSQGPTGYNCTQPAPICKFPHLRFG